MSVTIAMVGATYTKIVHPQDYLDDPWEEYVPDEGFFELNLSNTNFAGLMDFLKEPLSEDLCGSWKEVDLDRIQKKVLFALNTNKAKGFEEESYTMGNMHFCGRDASYVETRLSRLLTLIQAARVKNMEVVYV
jgi:hypothetical protein